MKWRDARSGEAGEERKGSGNVGFNGVMEHGHGTGSTTQSDVNRLQ